MATVPPAFAPQCSRGRPRRLVAVAVSCFLVAVACQAAVNLIFPTPAPTVAPTPCAGSGIVFSQRIDDVLVNAYCGVNESQATQVADYARYGIQHMPEEVKPALTMFIFTNMEQGIDVEMQWRESNGYAPAQRDRLRNEWNNIAGRAYYDGIFILLRNGIGSHGHSVRVADIVLHELHHIAQNHLLGNYAADAKWLTEGGADAITNRQLKDLGFSQAFGSLDPGCDFALSELERPNYKVPFDCPYIEGEKAVSLLIDQCGEDAYSQLFRESLPGRSVSRIFQYVYPFSLADFYAAFESYRLSSYSSTPLLCTELIKIQPTATPGK